MNSWKVIFATMVIFGAGVLTGGLLVKNALGGRDAKLRRPGGTNQPARVIQNINPSQMQRMEFLVRVNSELDLTPEQRERIERILKDGQDRTRQLWESISPDVRKELQLVRERIKVELTPEQRRRFEELMRKPPRPAARQGTNTTETPAPEAAPAP